MVISYNVNRQGTDKECVWKSVSSEYETGNPIAILESSSKSHIQQQYTFKL